MLQAEQISVGKQLLEYIDTKSTALSPALYHQPIVEYVSQTQQQLEVERLFRKGPLCVGLSGNLPGPGTYFTEDLGGVPLLLTRDENLKVRAFLNVCRHRGSKVAQGCNKARHFVCPYHAWTYGLDGKLVARPAEESFAGAPRETHGLTPIPVEENNGLLWVNPNPKGQLNVSQHLAGMDQDLAGYNLGDYHLYDSTVIRRRMNWKLIVDTFLESYHFCVLHKNTICSIFHENLQTFDPFGKNFRLVSPRRTIEELRTQSTKDWSLFPHIVGLYVLFPNTVYVWQLDHVELWHIYPDGNDPNQGCMRLSLYTPEPAVTETAKAHWDKNMELVIKVTEEEDFPVGEDIQQGFYSGAQDHITFGENEPGLVHFHQAVSAVIS
ncbi:MAG: SRPBCC family protein [Pseudomonadota bacterium]